MHDPDILSSNIVRKSFEIYREKLKPLVLFSLILFLPVQLLTDFITTPLIQNAGVRGLAMANFLGNIFIDILIAITYSIITALITETHISNEIVSNNTIITKTLKALPRAVKAYLILVMFILIISIPVDLVFVALDLEGLDILEALAIVIAWIYFGFSTQAVALRHKNATEALKYSKAIVTNNWWWTSGNYLLIGLISLSLAGVKAFLRRYLGSLPLYFISTGIAQLFAVPFLSIIITIIFLKLEVRNRVQSNQINLSHLDL